MYPLPLKKIAMNFQYKCDKCSRTFPTQKGMRIHQARFCNPKRKKPRSRTGSLADKAVKKKKRKEKEAEREHVKINGEDIDNVPSFEYLGSLVPNDGDDMTDVQHRMNIAQARFSGLFHIWKDHRLPVTMKLRLYICAVCSTFTHACEAWDLTEKVKKSINGFNSRCLHNITWDCSEPRPQFGVGRQETKTALLGPHTANGARAACERHALRLCERWSWSLTGGIPINGLRGKGVQ